MWLYNKIFGKKTKNNIKKNQNNQKKYVINPSIKNNNLNKINKIESSYSFTNNVSNIRNKLYIAIIKQNDVEITKIINEIYPNDSDEKILLKNIIDKLKISYLGTVNNNRFMASFSNIRQGEELIKKELKERCYKIIQVANTM